MEGDVRQRLYPLPKGISIHSLRMEGDIHGRFFDLLGGSFQSTPSAWRETQRNQTPKMQNIFQSTPSAWRETYVPLYSECPKSNFNPLPPHGGRQFAYKDLYIASIISIHSLRMEGDSIHTETGTNNDISIHSLRMEGDFHVLESPTHAPTFQSTPSAWRETVHAVAVHTQFLFQSTPSAWRETVEQNICKEKQAFQSTPSAWRETSACQYLVKAV